ncbi:hypothetical protein B5P43_18655 [Bacillus sp. SRB_336]|nr:hypothetical protein B5P43_18655 [Bacillus sp. SRB_336]
MVTLLKSTRFLAFSSVAAFVAGVYMLLWAISSLDLAFLYCNGTYSLAAKELRCQRPVFLLVAFVAFFIVGVTLGAWAFIRGRRRGASI